MNCIDKERFAELIKEYQLSMYRLSFGILKNETMVEDVISESIIKAYGHIGELRNQKKFKSWIMTIVANESKNQLKKGKREALIEDFREFEAEAYAKDTDVWKVVMELDEIYSKVIVLYYYEGFSVREIAKILGISMGTVKSRLSRARTKLREIL